MPNLYPIGLRALKLFGIAWLFIASFAILDILYLKSDNNEYLKACLRYHHRLIAVLDSEDADKITFDYLRGSDTDDIPSLVINRFYKDKAYAWQQCMSKPRQGQ